MANSLSRTFSQYVAGLSYEALPAAVVDHIKASLLHALIVAIVGAETLRAPAPVCAMI